MSIAALLARYGLPALFLGAGLEGETVVVAGGLMAHAGLVSLPAAMAAAAAGSCLADQLFFLIGRRFREHRLVHWIKAKPAFARAMAWLERYPIGFIFAFRFLYGLRTVSPFAIGTTQVATRTFVMVNIVAAIVWGVTFTAIGYAFGHRFEAWMARVRPSGHTILLVVAGIVAAAVLAHIGRWAWRRRRAA